MGQLDTVVERDAAPSAGTVDMRLEVVVIPVAFTHTYVGTSASVAPTAAVRHRLLGGSAPSETTVTKLLQSP